MVFRRRLKEGKTYPDFQEAWLPKEEFSAHFGVPGRIVNARRLDDESEILSLGSTSAIRRPSPPDPARE